jgi:hypothetical protein
VPIGRLTCHPWPAGFREADRSVEAFPPRIAIVADHGRPKRRLAGSAAAGTVDLFAIAPGGWMTGQLTSTAGALNWAL